MLTKLVRHDNLFAIKGNNLQKREIIMKKCDINLNQLIADLYELEDMINIQKCWINIANMLIEKGDVGIVNIVLILGIIEQKNIEIFDGFENIIQKSSCSFS